MESSEKNPVKICSILCVCGAPSKHMATLQPRLCRCLIYAITNIHTLSHLLMAILTVEFYNFS